jgi:Tfp pilus tip-associated adhesin PilY1
LDFTTTPAGEPSERITSGALIRTFKSADLPTRFIFVTSVPTSDPCAKSGISWLMELGTNCGRLEGASPFDLNGDDKFDKNDLVSIGGEDATVSGLQLNVQTGLVNEITTIGGPSSDPDHGIFYKLLPGTSGKVEKVTNSDDKPPSGGGLTPKRIYWEQIQ